MKNFKLWSKTQNNSFLDGVSKHKILYEERKLKCKNIHNPIYPK